MPAVSDGVVTDWMEVVENSQADQDVSMEPTAPLRMLKRGRDGDARDWTIYIPQGRTCSMCFTCGGPIAPRTVRVRLGAQTWMLQVFITVWDGLIFQLK